MNVRDAVTSFSTNPKIGFIGLGNMGAALAMRLLDPSLMVYDPDQKAMKPIVDGGAIAASDLAAMARQCDIIFACLPTSAVTETVLFGDDGMADHMKAGQIFIDMTSGDPAMSRDQAARLKQAGIDEDLIRVYIREILKLSVVFHLNGISSEAVPLLMGLLQGDPASPLLFTATVNRLMQPLVDRWNREDLGFKIGEERICLFAWMDDLYLFASS